MTYYEANHQGAAETLCTGRIDVAEVNMFLQFGRFFFRLFERCCQKVQRSGGTSDDPPGAPLRVLESLNPPLQVSPQLTDNNHLVTRDLRIGGFKV